MMDNYLVVSKMVEVEDDYLGEGTYIRHTRYIQDLIPAKSHGQARFKFLKKYDLELKDILYVRNVHDEMNLSHALEKNLERVMEDFNGTGKSE